MASIVVREHDSPDALIRKFKRACEKDSIIPELRRREFFEKPCWKRKRRKAAARKRLLKRLAKERPIQRTKKRRKSPDKIA